MKTVYEWDIETTDKESGDVLDHDHEYKLATHVRWYKNKTPDEPNMKYVLVLVKDLWDEDEESLKERNHWYPEEGGTEFSDGSKVPIKFVKEYNKQWIGEE